VQELGEQVGILYPDLRPPFQARQYPDPRGKTEWSLSGGVHVLRNTYVNWTPRIEPLILPRWLQVGMRLFAEYCRRFGKPDVIHAHCLLRAGVLAYRIARKYGIPYVVTEHSSRWHNHEVRGYELRSARAAAKNAGAMISVSRALMSHLQQDLAFGKTYVVPNAVDALFLDGEVRERPASQGKRFINVALLNPGKRHDILIDAFHQAFGRETSNTLYIVGDGPQRKPLEEQIARHGMESSIRLLGMQNKSQVAALLKESDCLVLTSDHETFGVVVIEALASGLPVISTDCGGTADIVAPGNGILTEKGNVRAVAEAMVTMHRRIDAGAYDKRQIRADCVERFSQHAVCAELVKIYKETLK